MCNLNLCKYNVLQRRRSKHEKTGMSQIAWLLLIFSIERLLVYKYFGLQSCDKQGSGVETGGRDN